MFYSLFDWICSKITTNEVLNSELFLELIIFSANSSVLSKIGEGLSIFNTNRVRTTLSDEERLPCRCVTAIRFITMVVVVHRPTFMAPLRMPVRCSERGKRPRASKGRLRACLVGTLFARDFSPKGDARIVRAHSFAKA